MEPSNLVISYIYKFNALHELTSGTETENGVTITYGANWEIQGRVGCSISSWFGLGLRMALGREVKVEQQNLYS